MTSPTGADRRARWMMVAIGFNTITSLTAIGLWLASPRMTGGAPRSPISTTETRPAPQRNAAPPPNAAIPAPLVAPRPEPIPQTAPQPSSFAPDPEQAAPPIAGRAPASIRPGVSASPSLVALATRLTLHPQILASELADENGELPPGAADKLERAHAAGAAIAQRLSLDEGATQSMKTLLTSYAFRVLSEQKQAAPGAVDPSKIEELKTGTVNDIRSTCGDEAANAAEREINAI